MEARSRKVTSLKDIPAFMRYLLDNVRPPSLAQQRDRKSRATHTLLHQSLASTDMLRPGDETCFVYLLDRTVCIVYWVEMDYYVRVDADYRNAPYKLTATKSTLDQLRTYFERCSTPTSISLSQECDRHLSTRQSGIVSFDHLHDYSSDSRANRKWEEMQCHS